MDPVFVPIPADRKTQKVPILLMLLENVTMVHKIRLPKNQGNIKLSMTQMKLLSLFLVLGISCVNAQFGILNNNEGDAKLEQTLQEASIDANGNVGTRFESLARDLQSVAPISPEDAIHIAVLLDAAKNDPETAILLSQMPKDNLKSLKDSATAVEIVRGLKQSLDELKAIEILFSNPERAVAEMDREGMIDKKRLSFYKKNPDALAEDTRKGVYFSFVSLAAAGEYL